jgi:hypothetical protein
MKEKDFTWDRPRREKYGNNKFSKIPLVAFSRRQVDG